VVFNCRVKDDRSSTTVCSSTPSRGAQPVRPAGEAAHAPEGPANGEAGERLACGDPDQGERDLGTALTINAVRSAGGGDFMLAIAMAMLLQAHRRAA
jgi:hypothetical protein